MSPNEARDFENLNRVEGLDEYRRPLNMAYGDDEPEQDGTPQDKEMLVIEAERRKAKTETEFLAAMNDYYNRKGFKQWQKS